jgi:hypothetical protein
MVRLMNRVLILCAECLLIASLLLSAAVSELFRTSHEISSAGHNTVVICGQNGTSVVTLDRDGIPIDPADTSCVHCTACTLVSVLEMPSTVFFDRAACAKEPNVRVVSKPVWGTYVARKLPRGPPSEFKT